ncbi:hypothetical protein RclHR1_20930004 [Rhizophagus clarus]|uniref:Uncharacterized protein n=1 Tax=Rhizophagus clarus TaxID=94130 RepID=A0A2Z6R7J1_9GLOM|nr:hypothetical protein RclHR1_20930004 [Rhizophagus clarus]
MHLILCFKRRSVMHQILQSYQNHLFSKLREAGDPSPMLRKLFSLSCWTISSSNWSSYVLIWGCLPVMFIDLFVDLSIPRQSAMKVVAAIHNNFIQKLRKRIWKLRTYDKSKWEDVMNITLKLKTTPRPSNLPATSYVPYSSLPLPTYLMIPRDSEIDWIKNSMTQGRGSFNPNSRKASHHKQKKDNNNSDNSGSDGENTVQQKCSRTISEQAIDDDIIADTVADAGVEVLASSPKENNTASTSLSSRPNIAAALSAPNDNASGGLDASMHARTITPASLPNASPDKATDDDPPVNQLLNFTTNKALIDAVNNTFLEMYESYTGKARMTGSGDAKRLIIHFHTVEARNACISAAHQQFPDLVFHAHDPKQLRSDEDL